MNLYPYTDFHELNDDWIIGHIKKNEKDIAALQNTIVNLNFEFDRKADKATTYTKTEVDNLLLGKANVSDIPDMSNYYDKTETNTLLANKANKATTLAGYGITDAYTKNEVNTSLANKADKATTLAGYGITDAYTQNEVDTISSGLQGQITGIKTPVNGIFTPGANVNIGSRNFWRKQNGFVYMTVVLSLTANLAANAVLLTNNDLTFVNNSYLYARKEDGTIEILTCNGHNIITEFGISSGTVLRIGATIFVQ